MSVTPTDDELIVALDFEGQLDYFHSKTSGSLQILGVDSVERSLQEDTLLVLFNAAISNLVRYAFPDLDSFS